MSRLHNTTLFAALIVGVVGAASAQQPTTLFSQRMAEAPEGIPAGGAYVPPGTLYDNEQSNGSTSLASQNSSGTLTARSADDFSIPAGGCASGLFDITQIRIQMVQADAAPQAFAVDLYDDNGSGTAPTPADSISPIATVAQTSQTNLGVFGAGTSIFEASFVPVGLQLSADTTYWISGYGSDPAANPSGFNNFFAASNGFAATTDNGVIIAPGAGVANWTAVDAVIGPPALAFSFAIDGTCAVSDADLSLNVTTSPFGVAPGGSFTYIITATNNGPGDAADVVVTHNLPSGATYVSNDCGASFVSPTVTWNIGTLANGASAVCNVSATANGGTVTDGSSTIASTTNDPTPANNTATSGFNLLRSIPSLSTLGLILLGLVLAGAALVAYRR